MKFDKYLQF